MYPPVIIFVYFIHACCGFVCFGAHVVLLGGKESLVDGNRDLVDDVLLGCGLHRIVSIDTDHLVDGGCLGRYSFLVPVP